MFLCEKNFVAKKKATEKLISVQISEELSEALGQYCGETRIKRGVVAVVLRWFLKQPGHFQQVITGEEVREWRMIYARALRDMANRVESDSGVEDVVHAMPDFTQSASAKEHPSNPKPLPAPAASGKKK